MAFVPLTSQGPISGTSKHPDPDPDCPDIEPSSSLVNPVELKKKNKSYDIKSING